MAFLKKAAAAIADGAAVNAAMLLALALRFSAGIPPEEMSHYLDIAPFLTLIAIFVNYFGGIYQTDWKHATFENYTDIVKCSFIFSVLTVTAAFFGRTLEFSRFAFFYYFLISCALLIAWRPLFNIFAPGKPIKKRVVIVGSGVGARTIGKILTHSGSFGREVAGMIDPAGMTDTDLRKRWDSLAADKPFDEVIITDFSSSNPLHNAVIELCRAGDLECSVVPGIYELTVANSGIEYLRNFPLIRISGGAYRGPYPRFKRLADITLALCLTAALMPLLAAIYLFVLLLSGAPAIYRQTRAGIYGQPFILYKFRTMVRGADSLGPGLTEKEDSRITGLGRFLRRFSLDELPQLVNVMKGNMSLVGPRPDMPKETDKFIGREKNVLAVRPGLTGLSQISGREDLELKEKICLDLFYINNMSFFMDMDILLKTLVVVFKKKGTRY